MPQQKLTILIISFNGWRYLDSCLNSILASGSHFFEIIVIDNASVDGTPEKLRNKYPFIRLILNPSNVGHTRAVNQGCRLADGDRILLLDADTELRADAIKQMSMLLDEDPGISMAAPRILNSDGTIQESARNFPSALNGIFGRQSVLTRLFPNNPFSSRYLAKYNYGKQIPYQVEHISAACMMFSKSLIETVGEWDEGYHSYWVDADWCKRLQEAGKTICCVPSAVIIHHEQISRFLRKSPVRIIKFHTGAYRFYRLHYTKGRWDPRSLAAGILLSGRLLVLLAINVFKKSPGSHMDPLSQRKPEDD